MAKAVVIDGITYTSKNSKNPYGQIAQAYANQYRQQTANQQAAMLNQLNQSKNSTNQSYESNAAQAYINYAKQKNSMNEQLAQRGINGGASESVLARMNNNYAQNVANNNASRSAALSELQKAYDTNVANMNNEMEMAIASNNAKMAQAQAQYQDTLNQRALQQYQATMGRFTSTKNIDKAIKKLSKKDPNYKAKKQLLQLRKAELKAEEEKKAISGGGGGGGGRSYRRGGYGGYSSSGSNSNYDSGAVKDFATALTSAVAKAGKKTTKATKKSVVKKKSSRKSYPTFIRG